ncbi:MAG: hypothetical protein HC915_03370 [Anaerolineae bacterium]|nr:hypothetical protein [Anaerolineae bacterium]
MSILVMWGVLSLSIFNMLILLWLGLTVFLAAEQRTRGLSLILSGTGMGALFFLSHTAILVSQFTPRLDSQLNFWWRVGWVPVVCSPILWYWLILWYSGWPTQHRVPALALSALGIVLLLLMFFSYPIPSYTEVMALDLAQTDTLWNMPLMFVLYPPFAILCILLPLNALYRPMPSKRLMGDLARQRSRPYLIVSSGLLLSVGIFVTAFLVWVLGAAEKQHPLVSSFLFAPAIALFDFFLTLLVAMAVLFLGRAVVSYEVFTGKTLPRRGFLRHWRNAIILSGGLSAFISASLMLQPPPLYSLLILASTTIVFYALLSWRSFVHRDYLIARFRPFVGSNSLVAYLTQATQPQEDPAYPLFETLCRDMLGTRCACLVPLGRLGPLVGAPLCYPPAAPVAIPSLSTDRFSPEQVCMPMDDVSGFCWAIPLWAERGLIGALLIDAKMDASLYTQEEIELARISAERIIDLRAGQEMARRLMALQRHEQTRERMLDLRTRRFLHDDILPTLHLAALHANSGTEQEQVVDLLAEAHNQLSNLIHQTVNQKPLRAFHWPDELRHRIEREFSPLFEAITWEIRGDLPALSDETYDILLPAVKEVVRNAATHGRGNSSPAPLHLKVQIGYQDQHLTLLVIDDGVGFRYHNTPRARGGNGLALHSTLLAILGGNLSLEVLTPHGTCVKSPCPFTTLCIR